MTMTMSIEMPDSFSIELRSLLAGLLQRDVPKRLGCRGRGAEEVKSHPFFRGIDWRVVYLQRLSPPLIPARGEVNAADAFDIGSFDDEDTKHIKLTEADQELYRNFPVVVSERWQHEIAETIFDYINHEADKAEMKRKSKNKLGYQEEEQSDCILHGYVKRLGGTFTATWLTRYVRLYPNRLELWSDSGKQPELIFMDQIEEVCNDFVQIKNEQCIVIKLYNHSKYVLTNSDEIGLKEWHLSLKAAHRESIDMMTTMAEKATKIYGTEIPLKHMGKRRQQLQQENAAANSALTASNWEQKIIQKELQASSRGKKPAGPAQADQPAANQAPLSSEPSAASTPAQAAANKKEQKAPQASHQHHHHHHHRSASQQSRTSSGQMADQQTHKHHRAHYSHRSHHHHHRHHHHHHHVAHSAAEAGQQQVASGPLHQHHHSHPIRSAAQSTTTLRSAASQDSPALPRDLKADLKPVESGAGEPAQATAESSQRETGRQPAEVAKELPANREESSQDEPAAAVEAREDSQKVDDKPAQQADRAAPEKPADVAAVGARTASLVSSSSSVSEAGSGSGSSASRSSCSSLEEGQADELGVNKLRLSDAVEGALPEAEVKKGPPSSAAPSEPAELTGQKERIKLAVSLENVSDQQEVLRDPSKRITSDNKQREQDLVAQYEKLNFSARNSSSSQENDEHQNSKTPAQSAI